MRTVRIGKLFILLLWTTVSYAETQKVGPFDIVVKVNSIDIPLNAMGALDVNTARGDFNLKGDIVLSASTSQLRDSLVAISKTVLPIRLPTPKCELWINNVSYLEIESRDNEVRLDAVVQASLRHCYYVLNAENKNIPMKVAILASAQNGNTLQWKVLRTPELDLPILWNTAVRAAQGNPRDFAKNEFQKFLDTCCSLSVSLLKGIRTYYSGREFRRQR